MDAVDGAEAPAEDDDDPERSDTVFAMPAFAADGTPIIDGDADADDDAEEGDEPGDDETSEEDEE